MCPSRRGGRPINLGLAGSPGFGDINHTRDPAPLEVLRYRVVEKETEADESMGTIILRKFVTGSFV